jgi:O-antigen/teichoic acid export membrane protein
LDRGKQIIRGIGSLTIQNVLSAFLGFVLLASLVRFLPQTDYGTYSSVQVTIGIAGVVSIFGLGSAVVRFLAPGFQGDGVEGWGSAKAALNITLVLSASVSIFMAAAAPDLSAYFGKGKSLEWVFYLGAAWLFASSVATSFQSMLQGMRRYGGLAKVLLGSRFVAVGIAVVGLALFHSLAIAIASQVLNFVLIISLSLPLVWRSLRGVDPRPHYGNVFRYAYLLGLANVVGAVAGNADLVVVGGYLSLGSLGIYNAVIQVASVLAAFFVTPLITAFFAEASFSSGNPEELKAGTSLALRFSMITVLPASFFAAAVSIQLFDLFSGGGSYSQGIPYLQLIALFYVFAAIQTIAITVLQGVSRTKSVLLIGAVTSIGEVALSISLVPGLGLAGAAYSRITLLVIGGILSLFIIRRYLPGQVEIKFYGKALLASVIPAALVSFLTYGLSSRVETLVPYTLLAVLLYFLCARFVGLLSPQDKSFIEHLLPARLLWILHFL